MFSNVYHVRKAGFYNDSLFMDHGVSILEDLVIMLADGIASMYLELISVDSSMSNEMNDLGLSLCTLSTRALQKLRNEVLYFCVAGNTCLFVNHGPSLLYIHKLSSLGIFFVIYSSPPAPKGVPSGQ